MKYRIFCHFGWFFCPFTPLATHKLKILKKKTKTNTRRYHHFTQVYQKSWSYAILFLCMVHDRSNFSFSAITCPFKSLTTQKFKIKKKKKMPGNIILHMHTRNYDHMIHGSWDIMHNRRTDGQMDRWTEKVTYRGGCPT